MVPFPVEFGRRDRRRPDRPHSKVDAWLGSGERVLVHQEELGDQVAGVVAGYLLWCRRLPAGPQAIAVTERLIGRQIGPSGRDLVAEVVAMRSTDPHARRSADRGEPVPSVQETGEQEGPEQEGQGERGQQDEPGQNDQGQGTPDRPVDREDLEVRWSAGR